MTTEQTCGDDAAYVLGALNSGERAAFERHLATCPRCQASIRDLAGLPGLLALAGEGSLGLPEPGVDPGPSDLLLPRLLTVVRRRRRRRVAGLVAAVVVTVASVSTAVVLAVRPAPAPSNPVPSASVALAANPNEPMAATIDLFDKQWGTSITVHCHEEGPHDSGTPYQLVVVDQQQRSTLVGSWTSIPGAASTITAATSLHRSDMSALQIKDSDGEVVLTAPVR